MDLKKYIQEHKNEFDDKKLSTDFDAVFKTALKNKLHQKPTKNKVVYLKYIALAACLILGIFIGVKIINQQEIKKELMANLSADSAGVRLEGIYSFSDDYTKEDTQIIKTLIKILHTDSNGNVKIATIDALLKFPTNELIRKNLIIALEKETLPLVQIKLITSVSFLREKRAQKSLKKIMENKQTFPIVKSNAALAMNNLKQ